MFAKFGRFFLIAAAIVSFTACHIQIGWNDLIDDKYYIDESDGPTVYQAPSVSIMSPANNAVLDQGTITLNGLSVSGTYPVSAIYLSVNNGLYLNIGTSPVWNQAFYAEPGVYAFSIFALDMHGNSSSTNRVTNIQVVGDSCER